MKFKLFGTEIYISFLFAAVVAFMLACDRTGLVIPTLFAAFIHETGHLFAMWAADCQPKSIRLVPSSVQIVRGFPKKENHEIIIALCGPAANIAAFAALFINFLLFENEQILVFSLLNVVLAVFNLLPVCGLDGGTVMTAVLAKKHGIDRAVTIVRITTAVLAITAFIAGVYLWINGSRNISVFIAAVYLVLCCLMRS